MSTVADMRMILVFVVGISEQSFLMRRRTKSMVWSRSCTSSMKMCVHLKRFLSPTSVCKKS